MKKESYLAPDADIFEMSLEAGILAASSLYDDGQIPVFETDDEQDWTDIWKERKV